MSFFESWRSNQGNLLIVVAMTTTLIACAFWHFQLLPEIELQPAQVIGDDDVRVIDTRPSTPSTIVPEGPGYGDDFRSENLQDEEAFPDSPIGRAASESQDENETQD